MKRKEISYRVLCVLGLSTVLFSCSHVYYAPNGQNVPLFKEKGEVQLAGGSAGSGEAGGANVQAAYAVGNNVGITANAYVASGSNDDTGAHSNGFVAEAGAGYFKPIGNFLVFEAYGGFGGGNIYNRYDGGSDSRVGFIRPYVQPAIGFTSNYFDLAFAPRFCMVNYTGVNSNGVTDSTNVAQLAYLNNNPTSFYFEPGITARAGWKYVKVQFQYVWSVNLNNPQLLRDNHNVSLGLFLSLAPRYRNTVTN